MNNPLPVDPFSVAEAARRTWPALIEAMLEAVCLVEPEGLRIVAANGAAGRLLGLPPADLVGRDMRSTAPTPEDASFWQRVGEKGGCGHILSDSYVTHAGGQAVPVVRRLDPADAANDRHRLAAGVGDERIGKDVAARALLADALPERLVLGRRRGREHVAADQVGRRHPEQAAGRAVGGDDAQTLGLDQADRLEHGLDQRGPGATRRLGDAERVDRKRVVHSSSVGAEGSKK